MQIKFKATKNVSQSCDSYRQIVKSGDLKYDACDTCDDVIHLYVKERGAIIIDCDKKTGEFTIKMPDCILTDHSK